jgi:hypothetical protein
MFSRLQWVLNHQGVILTSKKQFLAPCCFRCMLTARIADNWVVLLMHEVLGQQSGVGACTNCERWWHRDTSSTANMDPKHASIWKASNHYHSFNHECTITMDDGAVDHLQTIVNRQSSETTLPVRESSSRSSPRLNLGSTTTIQPSCLQQSLLSRRFPPLS